METWCEERKKILCLSVFLTSSSTNKLKVKKRQDYVNLPLDVKCLTEACKGSRGDDAENLFKKLISDSQNSVTLLESFFVQMYQNSLSD